MKQQDPLDFEEIAEYLEQPNSPAHADLRRRLLDSGVSRRRVDLAARIQNMLREDPQSVLPERGDESALTPELRDELELLRAGRLDDAQSARLRKRLQSDPRLLREALHYAFTEDTAPARAATRGSIGAWLAQALQWRVRAWAAAGATAALVVALLIVPGGSRDGGLQIASYRDDPVIRFAEQDALPGLGFFADAQTETHPYGEVEVRLEGTTLMLRWPQVAGASGYTVRLFVVERDSQREIAKRDVATSSAVLDDVELQAARRYLWVISGATADQRKFTTQGGFVVR